MFKKKITIILLILTTSITLSNCSESTNIDPIPPSDENTNPCNLGIPSISSNSPVTAGTNIILETPNISSMAEYYWTGPNGFTSYEQNPTIIASDLSAGTYSLIVNEGSCISATATVDVVVTAATAPCNPTNNTASNSVYPPMTFNSVNGYVTQDQYEINASGSNGGLTIIFANSQTPSAGVYSICPNCPSSFMDDNQVCVSIVTGGTFSDYFRPDTGNVYISYINGHISATFCGLEFSGTGVGYDFTASAKVTAF